METKPLLVVEDPPAVLVAGSEPGYASVDLDVVERAGEIAATARERALGSGVDPELRSAVTELSEAVEMLARQVQTLFYGIRGGRIAVTSEE